MKQTKAPTKAPTPNLVEANDATDNTKSVFLSTALDMSWRLAIVFLLPIIGGFQLDRKLDTSPTFTVIGFILALAGSALVMRRTLQLTESLPTPKKKDQK